MTRFTPVGPALDLAVTTLQQVIETLADGDTTRPRRSWPEYSPTRPTAPSPPSPPASASPRVCSTSGCPAPTPTPRTISAAACTCPPDTGAANAPRPTSWSWPAKAAPSAPSTPSSPARRRARPLLQRPRPHSSHPDLGRHHRHPGPRHSPRSGPLKRLPSTSISHRVATVAGIRRANAGRHQAMPGAGERNCGAGRRRVACSVASLSLPDVLLTLSRHPHPHIEVRSARLPRPRAPGLVSCWRA